MQGSATNQDGRSSSLTAPSGPAQQSLIKSAVQSAAGRVSAISLIATHGTGTPLGDPIETGAISNAVGKLHGGATLTLASVKASYGHTEGTAGIIPSLLLFPFLYHTQPWSSYVLSQAYAMTWQSLWFLEATGDEAFSHRNGPECMDPEAVLKLRELFNVFCFMQEWLVCWLQSAVHSLAYTLRCQHCEP